VPAGFCGIDLRTSACRSAVAADVPIAPAPAGTPRPRPEMPDRPQRRAG
jgi:hypothetical protein